MGYAQIDISEVGPAEYPLIAVLRDTIFGEFNHRYAATFAEQIDGRQDVLALIAHSEGNPVGYKVGYRDRPRHYHSWTGGVLPDYRREGIARRLQDWQHGWLRARGYQAVGSNSFNKFRGMLQFSLSTGFVPDGVNVRPESEISIHFNKDLSLPDPPRRAKRSSPINVHVESVGPTYHGLIAQLASETVEPATEADIDREMQNPNGLALVAFVDNKPVGFKIGHGRDARGHLFESRLGGVLPDYRGLGVAAALARRQIDAVGAMGYRVLQMMTRHDNVPMLRLAVSLGFNLNGICFHDRRKIALVILQLPLNSTL